MGCNGSQYKSYRGTATPKALQCCRVDSGTVFAIAFLSLVAGCATPRWPEFHGDGPNRGFIATHTSRALQEKWPAVDVGPVGYASPVIGADGTVYVGNSKGELIAVWPNSKIKWKFSASPLFQDPTIVGAPAVGADGNIYVVVTRSKGTEHVLAPYDLDRPVYRSVLLSINPNGKVNCSFPFDGPRLTLFGFTTASPKPWGSATNTHIAVVVAGDLYVLSQVCELIHKEELPCTFDLESGSRGLDFERLRYLAFVREGPHAFDRWFDPTESVRWLDPTVAVVTRIGSTNLQEPILAVVASSCGFGAFRWGADRLSRLWFHGEGTMIYSSPVVSGSGQLILGSGSGFVRGFDLQNSGNKLWEFDAHEPVLATPSILAGAAQTYAVSLNHVYVLDNNNVQNQTTISSPTTSSPAMTLDRLYFSSTTGGMHSLSFDLTPIVDALAPGGASSPAVAQDGTVYTITSQGLLKAYKGP